MGNWKSCMKSRTSDDFDRPRRKSLRERGIPDAESGLDSSGSSAERASSRASGRSIAGCSKSSRPVSKASQTLPSSHNQEAVLSALDADVGDLNQRSSSRTNQRILSSGSTRNKTNVIWVRSAESDDFTFEGKDFRDICFILWQKDERLLNNKDYKFSRNNGLQLHLTEKFYTEHPTFKVFRDLLDIYTENNTNKSLKQSIQDEFLDVVMTKEVMQICFEFLHHAQYFASDRNAFKKKLSSVWFPHAFQHIFAGVINGNQVSGLHNWFQFSLEKENINYERCTKQIPGIMVHMKYRWNGVWKFCGSMFVGTSPEFELALYTLLFFQALRERPPSNDSIYETTYDLNLGGRRNDPPNISIRVVVDTNSYRDVPHILKTAYPIKIA